MKTFTFIRALSLLLSLSPPTLASAFPRAQEIVLGLKKQGALGGVACESKECSEIGRLALLRGGNAVDALVATTFCVGVVGMYHSGIGGGGFMLVRDSEGKYEAIDFRETAPAAAYEDMYEGNKEGSVFGGLSVGIPGEVRGLEYVHQKYGKLPWKDLVVPAAELARDGFAVSEDLVRYMNYSISGRENFLVEDPIWAEEFAPNGTLLQEGDTIHRKRYADTLSKIAYHGSSAFYTGPIASSMITTIRQSNGTMTLSDLADYKIAVREPLSMSFRGYKLYTTGAPASGAVLLGILKIMEQYPLNDFKDVNLTTHRFDEAMRFAYGARLELGDPDFVAGVKNLEKTLLSDDAARDIKKKINDKKTQPVKVYDPRMIYLPENHGTSHVVTADKNGMATSLTTTINLLFGARIKDPLSGVILNDEMDDFSIPGVPNEFGFEPSTANYIRPGKRPLSSITPVIVERPDGSLYVTVGAAGGSRIISATTQAVWNVLEHNMTMHQALREPRLHDQLMPNHVTFEYTFDNSTVHSMVQKGHEVVWVREGVSAVHGIKVDEDGVFEAVGEPRQKNSAGMTA